MSVESIRVALGLRSYDVLIGAGLIADADSRRASREDAPARIVLEFDGDVRKLPLLDRGILIGIGLAGGFTAVAALAIILMAGGGLDHARWVAFTALVIGQVVRAYANRSLTVPVHRLSTNGFLAIAALVATALQVAIPFIPPLADAFRATPLTPIEWGVVVSVALAPAVVAQVARSTGRRWIA